MQCFELTIDVSKTTSVAMMTGICNWSIVPRLLVEILEVLLKGILRPEEC